MSEENKAVARRFFELWNEGDLDGLEEIMTTDTVGHDPQDPNAGQGLDGAKRTASMYRSAFPDTHFTIDDQIAEGDRVVTRWTATGTQDGELNDIPPSGKEVNLSGITIDRIEGGKIVEGWTNWDTLGMLQQLGAVPEAQAAR